MLWLVSFSSAHHMWSTWEATRWQNGRFWLLPTRKRRKKKFLRIFPPAAQKKSPRQINFLLSTKTEADFIHTSLSNFGDFFSWAAEWIFQRGSQKIRYSVGRSVLAIKRISHKEPKPFCVNFVFGQEAFLALASLDGLKTYSLSHGRRNSRPLVDEATPVALVQPLLFFNLQFPPPLNSFQKFFFSSPTLNLLRECKPRSVPNQKEFPGGSLFHCSRCKWAIRNSTLGRSLILKESYLDKVSKSELNRGTFESHWRSRKKGQQRQQRLFSFHVNFGELFDRPESRRERRIKDLCEDDDEAATLSLPRVQVSPPLLRHDSLESKKLSLHRKL